MKPTHSTIKKRLMKLFFSNMFLHNSTAPPPRGHCELVGNNVGKKGETARALSKREMVSPKPKQKLEMASPNYKRIGVAFVPLKFKNVAAPCNCAHHGVCSYNLVSKKYGE